MGSHRKASPSHIVLERKTCTTIGALIKFFEWLQ